MSRRKPGFWSDLGKLGADGRVVRGINRQFLDQRSGNAEFSHDLDGAFRNPDPEVSNARKILLATSSTGSCTIQTHSLGHSFAFGLIQYWRTALSCNWLLHKCCTEVDITPCFRNLDPHTQEAVAIPQPSSLVRKQHHSRCD